MRVWCIYSIVLVYISVNALTLTTPTRRTESIHQLRQQHFGNSILLCVRNVRASLWRLRRLACVVYTHAGLWVLCSGICVICLRTLACILCLPYVRTFRMHVVCDHRHRRTLRRFSANSSHVNTARRRHTGANSKQCIIIHAPLRKTTYTTYICVFTLGLHAWLFNYLLKTNNMRRTRQTDCLRQPERNGGRDRERTCIQALALVRMKTMTDDTFHSGVPPSNIV